MKTALILGGHGFIGHHMARRLKSEGYFVRTVDIKAYEYGEYDFSDDPVIGDLRDIAVVRRVVVDKYQEPYYKSKEFDLVFVFCCLMGGANYIFTGENDADIMHDSALMNLNVAKALSEINYSGVVFYSSSACIYPSHIQTEVYNPGLKETDAIPANPDSCYGYEKLFSEIMYDSFRRNKGLNIRIARFHNIYGPEGSYKGGKEKAPAAIARKIARTSDHCNADTGKGIGTIEVFGDGEQTRSFLYIDDCIDAVLLLIKSDYNQPLNIGSEEMVSINELVEITARVANKVIRIKHIDGPQGVRGRNSDNTLARQVLNMWEPKYTLKKGMEILYRWIESQIQK
jgi:GDP-D-mannose 3',5'-epimerase